MRALICMALLLVSGCASLVPAAQVGPDGFSAIAFGNVSFFEADLGRVGDTLLHADVYLPTEPLVPDAPDRFPTILVLSPYWGEGTQGEAEFRSAYDVLLRRMAPRGYAIVFGDLAGHGGSSGCWDMMGPVERASAVGMVDAIAAQPWSDGKVGMMGISYDAIAQIMAASDQAPHLVTIVPVAPLTHAYGGVMQNGVRYAGGWRAVQANYESSSLAPPGSNMARYGGWADRVGDSPACFGRNHLGDSPTDAYSAWYEARDYRAMGGQVRASVFYMQGFDDASVKPDNFGAWFDAVPTFKKAWLGHWPHAQPTALVSGRDDMYLTLHRWFDHELMGIENGIDAEPRIDVQDQAGQWRHEDVWPPADAAAITFDLAFGRSTFGGSPALPTIAIAQEIPLPQGLHVAGAPILDLTVASDRPLGQVIARLYSGGHLVSQGAFDLLFASGLDTPRLLTPGESVRISFALYPTDHDLEPGASLELVLATQDPQNWFEGDPSAAKLTVREGTLTLSTIARDAEHVFLVSCGLPMRPPIPDCWHNVGDLGLS